MRHILNSEGSYGHVRQMGAIPFETLKLARALREKAFQDEVATKTELGE